MPQTAQRVPPLAPEHSYFNPSEDLDMLLNDAKLSLHCLIQMTEGHDARGRSHMQEIRREELAALLRLIGHKVEHAETVYYALKGLPPATCPKANG